MRARSRASTFDWSGHHPVERRETVVYAKMHRARAKSITQDARVAYATAKWTITPIIHTQTARDSIANSTSIPTPVALSASILDLRAD